MTAIAAPVQAAVEPPAHVIVEPDWARRPTGDDLGDAYPPTALLVGAQGFAVLHCTVSIKGVPGSCDVLQEAPAGLGFGDAALAVSRRFLFTPRMVDGQATADGVVNIPLTFSVPGGQSYPGGAPALLVREASPGQSLPTSQVGPCPPEATGKLCVSEPLVWSAAPQPTALIGLYGVVALRCRITATGSLDKCASGAETPDAHVTAAEFHVSQYRAPKDIGGRTTSGGWALFYIVPPGRS